MDETGYENATKAAPAADGELNRWLQRVEGMYTTACPLLSSPHLVVSDVTSGDVWRVPGDIERVGGDICQ